MSSMEVWIDYASTYSYLTVARIGRLAAQIGVTLDWQPFFLPPVREHHGLGFPFPEASAKTAHMWRDLERRAEKLGIPYRHPSTYPVNSLPAARVALAGKQDGTAGASALRSKRFACTGRKGASSAPTTTCGGPSAPLDSMLRRSCNSRTRQRTRKRSRLRHRAPLSAASSVRRPLSSAASCSGATTVSRTQSTGR